MCRLSPFWLRGGEDAMWLSVVLASSFPEGPAVVLAGTNVIPAPAK